VRIRQVAWIVWGIRKRLWRLDGGRWRRIRWYSDEQARVTTDKVCSDSSHLEEARGVDDGFQRPLRWRGHASESRMRYFVDTICDSTQHKANDHW